MSRAKDDGVLIVSNLDLGDNTFDSDRGSWNTTRAIRDCLTGQHGDTYVFQVTEMMPNIANVDIDEAKVAAMLADKDSLLASPPLVFVEDDGKIWLIDGHHRLHAMARLGYAELAGYVIESRNAERYRVLFNGRRIAPWYEKRRRK
ncbi:MAG TPA: ParB/Srx family N-terminal domain-containing protein [Xanthobacteraceae bacterium]|jgi:hypothetical protein